MYKIILLFVFLQNVKSASILGVFLMTSISHQSVFQPIWRELSLRGHKVTVLTPNPLHDATLTNLTEIDLGFTYDIGRESNMQYSLGKDRPAPEAISATHNMLQNLAIAQVSHPQVQDLIQDQNRKFDVLLVEFIHPLIYALSARFNCPMIGITSLDAFLVGHDAVGNPSHPVLNPDLFLPVVRRAGFYERLYSCYVAIWCRYYYHYHVLPANDKIARKYISEDIPYLGDIVKNVSMLFVNINPIFYPIRPNVPAVVLLGKMHIKPKKPLPQDLQKELDNAKEGVVYFSLGSIVRSTNLTLDQREVILSCFGELPYKILWKWEDDALAGKPSNVVIRKWFPQQDVLGHPNVKVFITQGGLQSLEESIINGVPIVGLPFIADQPTNVIKTVELGIAKALDPSRLIKEELKTTIIEVVENPMYRKRVMEIRKLFMDEPMTGLEKAVWWTEYVIRHKGARHLRSPAVDMPWHQYLLLDVIGLVLGVVLVSFWILYKIIRISFVMWKKYVLQSKAKIS